MTSGGIAHRLNRGALALPSATETFETMRPTPVRAQIGASQFDYGQAPRGMFRSPPSGYMYPSTYNFRHLNRTIMSNARLVSGTTRVPTPAGNVSGGTLFAPQVTVPKTTGIPTTGQSKAKKSKPVTGSSSKAPVLASPSPIRLPPPIPSTAVASATLPRDKATTKSRRAARPQIVNPSSMLVPPEIFMAAARARSTTTSTPATINDKENMNAVTETPKSAGNENPTEMTKVAVAVTVAPKAGLAGSKWAPGGEYAEASSKPMAHSVPAATVPTVTSPAVVVKAVAEPVAEQIKAGLDESKWAPGGEYALAASSGSRTTARTSTKNTIGHLLSSRQLPSQPAPIVVASHTEDPLVKHLPIAISPSELITEATSPADSRSIAVQSFENTVTSPEHHVGSLSTLDPAVRQALENSKFANPGAQPSAPDPTASRPVRTAMHHVERFSPYERAHRFRNQLLPIDHARWMARQGERRVMNSDVMRGYPLLRDTLLRASRASEADEIIKYLRQ